MANQQPSQPQAAGALVQKEERQPPTFGECTGMTTILVGKQKQKFVAYKEFLTFYSRYFAAALEGEFKEAHTNTIWLEEEEPAIFSIFLDVLYTRKAMRPFLDYHFRDYRTPSGACENYHIWPSFIQLIDLWVLLDYLQAPKLQNYIIDVIIEKNLMWDNDHKDENQQTPKLWEYAFKKTMEDSPLPRLFAAIVTYYEYEEYVDRRNSFSKEMLQQVIDAFYRKDPEQCSVHPEDAHMFYVADDSV